MATDDDRLSEPTQDAPLEDTHETNNDQRISGIVAQTRADLMLDTVHGDVRSTLERRLSDAGVSVDDRTLDELVERIERGDVDVADPGVEQI